MCIAWQWPAWTIWLMTFPFAISAGLWFGAYSGPIAATVYLAPPSPGSFLSTILASLETGRLASEIVGTGALRRRLQRVIPYVVISSGMLPHQFSAFAEGLFGSMHSEFERTPKAGSEHTSSVRSGSGQDPPAVPARRGGLRGVPVHVGGAVRRRRSPVVRRWLDVHGRLRRARRLRLRRRRTQGPRLGDPAHDSRHPFDA